MQITPKTKKNELPQVGLEPATLCILVSLLGIPVWSALLLVHVLLGTYAYASESQLDPEFFFQDL